MDNASKNAGDMIDTLTMKYNRGRQAAITNELVDIITGILLFFLPGRSLTFLQVPVPFRFHVAQIQLRHFVNGIYL